MRVMLRETCLPFSSDNLQLERNDVVPITLTGGKKHHVSIFSSSAPSHFIASHIYVPLLRSRQRLTMWRPNWRIVKSFQLMLRSMGKLSQGTSSTTSRRMRFCKSDLLRLGKLFVMRFGRNTFSYITTTTYRRTSSSHLI
jgi:hypothetical protein